jgi:signal peptidase I
MRTIARQRTGEGSTSCPLRASRWVSIVANAAWIATTASVAVMLLFAWLAGWRLDIVGTPSMAPAVPAGSLAVVVPVGIAQVRVGDVIAFRDADNERIRVLHRVVRVSDRREAGGDVYLYTRGDANRSRDRLYVGRERLLGRLQWSLPRAGGVLWRLRTPVGPVVFVAFPALVMVARRLRVRRVTPGRVPSTAVPPVAHAPTATTFPIPDPLWGGRFRPAGRGLPSAPA